MFLGSLPRNMGRLPMFLGVWTGFEIALTGMLASKKTASWVSPNNNGQVNALTNNFTMR